ncbi:MAG: CDP-diacylglycerol--serine O-phosphatidyltransferase [Pseudomonadales bacterium]|jgi:CDP-diacylglycerol--serine O-phosphatidyltransferase|nr:CDP-diacylglycerol--serine O-phosphatidyltransferase [Pseudomonadales bacterium]
MAQDPREHEQAPPARRLHAIDPAPDPVPPGNGEGVDDGDPDRQRRRGIYLLPNLITTGALFSGFFAIVAAMNGRYETAAMAVFAALVLDAADGRVARLTHTESAFGAEYDSLSDMVAFGVAPALVIFSWSLQSLGQLGWVATFIYMACAALRLARFNMRPDNSSFVGLASPSAAALIAGTVWVFTETAPTTPGPEGAGAVLLAALTAGAGLLMVSPLRYWSPKNVNLKGRVPFVALVAIVLGYALIMLDPPRVLLGGFVAYAFSGPVLWVLRRRRQAVARAEREG